jgi:hydroxymethylpyrimidine/phosphomethylpyrimidine kinase
MLSALTIGTNDPTGGSGLSVDLATIVGHGLSSICVVAATMGPTAMYALPRTVVGGQLSHALRYAAPTAVKVETLASAEIVGEVAGRARAGELPHLVVDPDLSCTTGGHRGIIGALLGLLPHAEVATPNVDEAAALLGWAVSTPADMAGAAAQLAALGCKHVVITGGRLGGEECVDVLWTDAGARFLKAPRLPVPPGYGTGSLFSAAITAGLALGRSPMDAVSMAKEHVMRSLTAAQRRDEPAPLAPVRALPRAPTAGGEASTWTGATAKAG